MERLTFSDLVAELLPEVCEIWPWDLADELAEGRWPMLLDVRCPGEYERMHIAESVNVPRGILETACDYGYEETMPRLVEARDRRLVVICRSGNRSILAAHTLQRMGYRDVASLKLGLRGWNDEDLPLFDGRHRQVDPGLADAYFMPRLEPEKLRPPAEAAH